MKSILVIFCCLLLCHGFPLEYVQPEIYDLHSTAYESREFGTNEFEKHSALEGNDGFQKEDVLWENLPANSNSKSTDEQFAETLSQESGTFAKHNIIYPQEATLLDHEVVVGNNEFVNDRTGEVVNVQHGDLFIKQTDTFPAFVEEELYWKSNMMDKESSVIKQEGSSNLPYTQSVHDQEVFYMYPKQENGEIEEIHQRIGGRTNAQSQTSTENIPLEVGGYEKENNSALEERDSLPTSEDDIVLSGDHNESLLHERTTTKGTSGGGGTILANYSPTHTCVFSQFDVSMEQTAGEPSLSHGVMSDIGFEKNQETVHEEGRTQSEENSLNSETRGFPIYGVGIVPEEVSPELQQVQDISEINQKIGEIVRVHNEQSSEEGHVDLFPNIEVEKGALPFYHQTPVTEDIPHIKEKISEVVPVLHQMQPEFYGFYGTPNYPYGEMENFDVAKVKPMPIESIRVQPQEAGLLPIPDEIYTVAVLPINQGYAAGQYLNPIVVPPESGEKRITITAIEPIEQRRYLPSVPLVDPTFPQHFHQTQGAQPMFGLPGSLPLNVLKRN